jgi:hypothetical protein
MYAMARATMLALVVLCLGFPASARPLSGANGAATLSELYNLDFSTGNITVFRIVKNVASVVSQFKASATGSTGLAVDRRGRIYTAVNGLNAKPCTACVEVFSPQGGLVARIAAPILPGAPGAPNVTDVSVDDHDNIYVSDYGQQAVYMFSPDPTGWVGPTIVVQNSLNAASVTAEPDGVTVLVSGGCGFASVRPYVRTTVGYPEFRPGACFPIGTLGLFGAAVENDDTAITPVDVFPGLVSMTSPSGGFSFTIPDRLGGVGGVARGGSDIVYVSDSHNQTVYAFARPAKGWLSGQPTLIGSYTGFQGLDVIAVPPH